MSARGRAFWADSIGRVKRPAAGKREREREIDMRGWLSSFRLSADQERRAGQEVALLKTKDIATSSPVVIFSRTYCPLCQRVQRVLSEQGATFKTIELNEESDGSAMYSALMKWTGQVACPNIFIGGKHVGGHNFVMSRHREGKLVPLLVEAGAIDRHPR